MENVTVNTPAEKAEETKAEKFIRLEEYRINKAIDAIGRLENLANKSAYEYTPEQVEAMFVVLESKVAEVKAKFTVTKNKENAAFSFGNKAGQENCEWTYVNTLDKKVESLCCFLSSSSSFCCGII